MAAAKPRKNRTPPLLVRNAARKEAALWAKAWESLDRDQQDASRLGEAWDRPGLNRNERTGAYLLSRYSEDLRSLLDQPETKPGQ